MCDSDPFCGERVKFIDKWWPKLLLCHSITRITISYSSERVDSVSLLCNRESVRSSRIGTAAATGTAAEWFTGTAT